MALNTSGTWKSCIPEKPCHEKSVEADAARFDVCRASRPAKFRKQRGVPEFMRIDYYLGIIRAELYFREARSLKDRRGHVRSLTDRLSNMGFSVTRTGPPDLPRQAWLVAVVASGSGSWIRRKLERAGDLFYDPRWELMDISMDIIAADQELPDWETT